MTRERWSGRVARRASAVVVTILLGLTGAVAVSPTAPATAATPPGGAAVAVTVGQFSSCALTTLGGVKCWGSNLFGLGDGISMNSRRPVDVVGLTSGVAQVSAGFQTTCAVTTAGGVKCWGYGSDGELGNGVFGPSKTPVDVVGLTTGVASVSVGAVGACAVTVAGAVKCWGAGNYGALGDGRVMLSATPVDVVGLGSGVRGVTVGWYGACALTASGVSCWGQNYSGALGNGTVGRYRTTPTPVVGLGPDTVSVTGSGPRCASTSSGRVLCWGHNSQGLLGVRSPQATVSVPRPVRGLTDVSAITVGGRTTCVARSHRTWCWGLNTSGAVGDGTTVDRTRPVPVVGLPGPARSVATNGVHTCAVTPAGRVFCWGTNGSGQLGDGTTTEALTPVRVVGLGG